MAKDRGFHSGARALRQDIVDRDLIPGHKVPGVIGFFHEAIADGKPVGAVAIIRADEDLRIWATRVLENPKCYHLVEPDVFYFEAYPGQPEMLARRYAEIVALNPIIGVA